MGWKARLPVMAAALWWGSLSAIGFMAVPLLFSHLPTPAMAGGMAAKLFTAQTWLSLACGLVVLYATAARPEPLIPVRPELPVPVRPELPVPVRPEPVEGPVGASTGSARTEAGHHPRTEAGHPRTEEAHPRTEAAHQARTARVEGFVLAGLILALLVEFAVAPRIVARQNLALWHSLGSAMYLAQWLCAGVTLGRLSRAGAS